MLVEQDGFYLNAQGEILKIEIMTDGSIKDESGNIYLLDGRHIVVSELGKYDLIGYIPKELHYRLLESINGYYTCEPIKTFIDNFYKGNN